MKKKYGKKSESSYKPDPVEANTTRAEHNISGSAQDERHNENQTSAAMLLQVLDENNAEEDFVPGERGSGKTASEKIGFKS